MKGAPRWGRGRLFEGQGVRVGKWVRYGLGWG